MRPVGVLHKSELKVVAQCAVKGTLTDLNPQ